MAGHLPLTRPKRMSAVTGRPMISPNDISSTAPPGGNVVSMTGNCPDGIGVKATGNWKDGSRPETNGVRRRRNRSLLDKNNFKRNSRLFINVYFNQEKLKRKTFCFLTLTSASSIALVRDVLKKQGRKAAQHEVSQ